MKFRLIAAAVAAVFIGLGTDSFAQSNTDRGAGTVAHPDKGDSFTHGESQRCESLSGAARDQCDKEEATKTQGAAAQEADRPATANASGSTGSAAGGSTFTHGESKRCESLSGAAKDQCDKEEATKTEGEAAREASK